MAPKKGKKGKKKNAYPPEVTRFLQSHEFKCLQSLLELPGGVPSAHQPSIDPDTQQSIASFLSVLGRIATSIKLAEDEDLQGASNQFLMDVDFHVNGIVEWVQQGISTDFATMGLVSFQVDLRERVRAFDAMWVEFEERICLEIEKVMKDIFKPVDAIVDLEMKLSILEDAEEYEAKRGVEQQLIAAINDAIEDAEACIFYDCKLPSEVVEKAKKLIKQYLKCRSGWCITP
ncbi:hypothetical protein CSUI_006124 [Cystoisospora suis]|uniref:Uncharacterized protein n=1 Tax=Cystoisospora suis TaxID=483139 RepID=A0A2C6K298_9APIC|nr:hypothetical protein CSUI_006124 [Cystoisospora suis]